MHHLFILFVRACIECFLEARGGVEMIHSFSRDWDNPLFLDFLHLRFLRSLSGFRGVMFRMLFIMYIYQKLQRLKAKKCCMLAWHPMLLEIKALGQFRPSVTVPGRKSASTVNIMDGRAMLGVDMAFYMWTIVGPLLKSCNI